MGRRGRGDSQRRRFQLPSQLTERLLRLAHRDYHTLFALLTAAFGLTIHKAVGLNQVGIAMPTLRVSDAKRQASVFATFGMQAEHAIPAYLNAVLTEMKHTYTQALTAAEAYRRFTQEELKPMYRFAIGCSAIHDLEAFVEHIGGCDSRLTLLFTVEDDGCLSGELTSGQDEMDADEADSWIRGILHVLEQLSRGKDCTLSDIKLLTEEEEALINRTNDTASPLPPFETVTEWLEATAHRYAGEIALEWEANSLTYEELNRAGAEVADMLRAAAPGTGPGSRVCIMLERSPELIAAVVGVLKTGAAYVPIDPDTPAERVRFVCENSGIAALIADRGMAPEGLACPLVELRAGSHMASLLEESGATARHGEAQIAGGQRLDTAYIIYTSGSTGQPKGVEVSHLNVLNYLGWAGKRYTAGERLAFPFYSSIAFDLTVTSIFLPLVTGGRIVIYTGRDAASMLHQVAQDDRSDIIKLTPSHLKLWTQLESAPTVRKMIVGGEQLSRDLAEAVHAQYGGRIEIYNEYGPTEATVGCMTYLFDPDQDAGEAVPVGVPGGNSAIYILNANREPVSTGMTGEMYIVGQCVAKGYWGQSALTGEKFVTDPFKPESDAYMYKTGDLARRLPNGMIVYEGRADEQIKLNGYRIEKEEIERTLRSCPGVQDAKVVVCRAKLLAYYVADTGVESAQLQAHAEAWLPHYMLPAGYVPLAAFPLTRNGKVDASKLPDPVQQTLESAEPASEIEQRLIEVCKEVLGLDKLDIHDDLVYAGLDSIKAIQISARLYKQRYTVDLNVLLLQRTVRTMASAVQPANAEQEVAELNGELPLSPIQLRFFEHHGMLNHYNQSLMLYRREGFEPEALRAALHALVAHHDALRVVFKRDQVDGQVRALYKRMDEVVQPLLQSEAFEQEPDRYDIDWRATALQSSFDLSDGPLFRTLLLRTGNGDHLLLAAHHLVMDGVSWRILLEDLAAVYAQTSSGQQAALPGKTVSYADWVTGLKSTEQSGLSEAFAAVAEAERQMQDQEQGQQSSLLPDRSKAGTYGDALSESLTLEHEATRRLLTQTTEAFGARMDELLLTAMLLAARDQFGRQRIAVDLEGHGRDAGFKSLNVSRTIGWFTSVFPLRLALAEDDDVRLHVMRVREHYREASQKGWKYGVWRYLNDWASGENAAAVLTAAASAEIGFNYLGQLGGEFSNELFTLSDWPTGRLVSAAAAREYPLEFIAVIAGGKLSLQLIYNLSDIDREGAAALLKRYEFWLRTMLEETEQGGRQAWVSIDQLDSITVEDAQAILMRRGARKKRGTNG